MVFCVSIIANTSNAYAEAAKAPIILIGDGGAYNRDSLPRNGKWLGLFCENAKCKLSEAFVLVGSSTAWGVLGEEDTDIFHAHEDPIAIFTGIDIPEREVQTWFLGEDDDSDSSYKALKALGSWKMPWGAKPLKISWVKLPDNEGFRYHIGDESSKQFLFRTDSESHYGGDTTPHFNWVGDMDGDNKIDFILSLPDDNCGFDIRLYLSSLATSPDFIKKAAQHAGSVPACGC